MIFVKTINDAPKKFSEQIVTLYGFCKQNRFNGKIGFINFNDGTSFKGIQVVYKKDNITNADEISSARNGAALEITGMIVLTPDAPQPFELQATNIKLLKQTDESYPLQNKQQGLEFLRDNAHLRPRTQLFSAVMKIRSELAYAIHTYFHQNNYIWVATPLITSNDGEGAGETFFLTTNDNEDFFGQKVNLTVTGQLHGEAYAQAFRNIYTFGPTFRAEKSHTARHAAEFWMIEPEIAFCDLTNLMLVAEDMLKFVVNHFKNSCQDEIEFLKREIDPNIENKISMLLNNEFNKMTYEDGIKILADAVKNGHKFEDNNIYFGMDLGSEHERYLCETIVNGPLFLYNYPKQIKAFYMKQNDDGITVAASDLLVPGVGELVGGSQREDDYDKLLKRCQELKMDLEPLNWYLNLRKYGYYMSSGFGLGFERLIMYLTGVNNIRDVIPFPRTHGSINF